MTAEPELRAERREGEPVVVRAGWRARAVPAGLAEAVRALLGRRGRWFDTLRQLPGGARQVEHDPVGEIARVRIIDDEDECDRAARRVAPCERRRDIRAVAGELTRD